MHLMYWVYLMYWLDFGKGIQIRQKISPNSKVQTGKCELAVETLRCLLHSVRSEKDWLSFGVKLKMSVSCRVGAEVCV